ncbi:arginase [Halocalculus aciditolerans]|uniref:Arginase n=1 Tax=Halocalculus aciditolerans TaxID=1383812 RepID=A0A830FLX2_9EURY|nr:arginase [Halocalculus aciditolerans]GGL59203.1 arginase [Halocalculus aciditolerans]
MTLDRPVRIIGAPSDYGANRRGVDMGPSAIRYAGLAEELEAMGLETTDEDDLPIPRAETRDPDVEQLRSGNAKFLRETREVCEALEARVADAIEAGMFPLVLGGDHSIAIGSLNGAGKNADVGAIWFDAHGDFNTPETSPSGNVHGMPLAAALGRGAFAEEPWASENRLREENVVYVGLRSVDDHERDAINASEMTAFTMSDIDERGIGPVVEDALDAATAGVDGIHVSFDMDWLDPNEAPGVGTPVRGGSSYREAHSALELVAERHASEGVLRSMELVEVNPILDSHNQTADLAVELAASALGKRIL